MVSMTYASEHRHVAVQDDAWGTQNLAAPGPGSEATRVLFSCCKGETHTHKHGYKQLFRRLRSMYRPEKLDNREDLCKEILLGSGFSSAAGNVAAAPAILVLGCPTQPFSAGEFEQLKSFIAGGGSLMVLMAEGGEGKAGTNINYLLEEFGIAVNNDTVVRTAHYKYMHPKEALISDGILNRAIPAAVAPKSTKQLLSDLDDAAADTGKAAGATPGGGLDFVYPYGCTLSVQRPAVPLLSSGRISYPMQQPLGGWTAAGRG
jgi:intraflagellar transport protein 52